MGHPVISNCGTPTEKDSEILDHHLHPITKAEYCYAKDENNFQQKLKIPGKNFR